MRQLDAKDDCIAARLHQYQPQHQTVVPERLIGYGRSHRSSNLDEVVLCVDQSGSMATSVVYSSIFAAVLASIPALRTARGVRHRGARSHRGAPWPMPATVEQVANCRRCTHSQLGRSSGGGVGCTIVASTSASPASPITAA